MNDDQNQWLTWAKQIQAIAQTGLTFSRDPFDTQRYQALQEIAAEIIAKHSQLSKPELLTLIQQNIGYATPKIDVRAAIIKDHKILLVKETADQLWTLPGGWADIDEAPSEAVSREVYEESGFQTEMTKLIALYDINKHAHPSGYTHAYKAIFLGKVVSGEAKTSIETLAVDFFPADKIPTLSLPRVTYEQIATCFKHFENFDLPTEYD